MSESEGDLFNRISQTKFAGLSKQNYHEKIDKNQRKISKLQKLIGKGGNMKKRKKM